MSSSADKDPNGQSQSRSTAGADTDLLVELNALLGRGTSYEGKLYFDGRVRIEGRFSGEIRGEDVLVIGHGAEVDGAIDVGVCIVTGGRVRANIRARDAIELHVPAVVKGELSAPNIFIDRGVQFEGKCKMAPLDQPDAEPAPPADESLLFGEPGAPAASPAPPAAATLPGAPLALAEPAGGEENEPEPAADAEPEPL